MRAVFVCPICGGISETMTEISTGVIKVSFKPEVFVYSDGTPVIVFDQVSKHTKDEEVELIECDLCGEQFDPPLDDYVVILSDKNEVIDCGKYWKENNEELQRILANQNK